MSYTIYTHKKNGIKLPLACPLLQAVHAVLRLRAVLHFDKVQLAAHWWSSLEYLDRYVPLSCGYYADAASSLRALCLLEPDL